MSPAERLPFRIDARASGSRARAATFRSLHGEIRTPLFMPVGTQATVKAQTPESLAAAGSQILLANTYHLLLRPGPEVFERLGGIHRFMAWPGSVLTDSGGFQIFSLPNARSMTEAGAVFQSYIDNRRILLSPELSIQTQRAIGSDIMMVLDQCIASTAPEAEARAALQVTQRWAARSLAARADSPQALFAIVQGALFPHLRQESAAGLTPMPFDGFAIGGLAVGESKPQREDICELTSSLLPEDRPRYLMGVGMPIDLLEAVHRGVDMFDCIIPTQVAQRGTAFTSRGLVELRRSVYKFSDSPLDPACTCPVCATHSRAYLHHLTKTQETLGWSLIGHHNVHFYHQLMREVRESILADRFLPLYHEKRAALVADDPDHPISPPKRRPAPAAPHHLGDYVLLGSVIHHLPTQTPLPSLHEINLSPLLSHLHPGTEPLIVWDLGLGTVATALAIIDAFEKAAARIPTLRPLQLYSFSSDLTPLRLALHHKKTFPHLRHGAADTLLHRGAWTSRRFPHLTWQLNPPSPAPQPTLILESPALQHLCTPPSGKSHADDGSTPPCP